MVVSMRSTSVPRWNTGAAALDSVLGDDTISCLLVMADASIDEKFVQDLAAKSAPTTRIIRVDGAVSASVALDEALSEAKVGWRFLVLGIESTVGRIRARLMRAGAIEAEIVVLSTEEPDIGARRLREMFCAHCHAVTGAESIVDGTADCSGCGAQLTLYYHYSRRHGAYLGYRADSEDLT